MNLQIDERQGWSVVGVILIGSILIGLFGNLHLSHNDLYFTFSAILQGFILFLTFFIIVLYNELRNRKQIITEIEKRVFNFINETLGWLFFRWDEKNAEIERVIDANIDKEGFANRYFKSQLNLKFIGKWFDIDYGAKHIDPNELIVWKKFGEVIDKESTMKRMGAEKLKMIEEYFKWIESMINECKEDTDNQQQRLKYAKEERNQHIKEYFKILQKVKQPIVSIGIVIGICIFSLPFVSVLQKHFQLNSFIISFVIFCSAFSIFWLLDIMYYLLKEQI